MDHFKQAIYVEAIELLKRGDAVYCCDALLQAAQEVFGTYRLRPSDIKGLVPEFQALDDRSFWGRTGEQAPDDVGGWWERDWIEPRIRALDLALRRCG